MIERSQHASHADESQDRALVAALRQGDAAAFTELIERYHPSLVRLALPFVGDRAAAEDVAQETWLGVLRGLDRFEGRSSLRTWIFRILTNRAKTRGVRDGRVVPFSDVWSLDDEPAERAVEDRRFLGADEPGAGGWRSAPAAWEALPEQRLLAAETRALIERAIAELPASQRAVISLRDVEGWTSPEVCAALGVSEVNQRVLLHRARSRVRQALEQYLAPEQS